MPRRKKKPDEYHTGRLNISCSPSVKDRIATTATQRGLSISQYILELEEKSEVAGTSEHLARVGLDLVGLKKRLTDIETSLRRSLARSQGTVDAHVEDDLARLREVEAEIDEAMRETVAAVKLLKADGR